MFGQNKWGRTAVLLLVVCVALSGCQSFHKKFVRKKKKTDSNVGEYQVVLQPEEFVAPSYSSDEEYRQYYSLAIVWMKDYWRAMDGAVNDKRIIDILTNLHLNLTRMKSVLSAEVAVDLDGVVADVQWALEEMQKVEPLRNYGMIKRKLRTARNILRQKYAFSEVEKYF